MTNDVKTKDITNNKPLIVQPNKIEKIETTKLMESR